MDQALFRCYIGSVDIRLGVDAAERSVQGGTEYHSKLLPKRDRRSWP